MSLDKDSLEYHLWLQKCPSCKEHLVGFSHHNLAPKMKPINKPFSRYVYLVNKEVMQHIKSPNILILR